MPMSNPSSFFLIAKLFRRCMPIFTTITARQKQRIIIASKLCRLYTLQIHALHFIVIINFCEYDLLLCWAKRQNDESEDHCLEHIFTHSYLEMHTYKKNCKRLSTSVCPVRKQTAFLHLLESACLSSLMNSEPSSNKPKWTVLTTGSRGIFRAGWHVPGQLFDATIVNICLVSWETDVQRGYPSRGINCSRLLFSRKQSINYLSGLLLKIFDVPPNFNTRKVQNMD